MHHTDRTPGPLTQIALGTVLSVSLWCTIGTPGCGAAQQPLPVPPELVEAISAGICTRALLQGVDPQALTLEQLRELTEALRGCGKPAHTWDAGAP